MTESVQRSAAFPDFMLDLDRTTTPDAAPFALLYRPESHSPDLVEFFEGEVTEVESLGQLPLSAGEELLAVIPYRQVTERGFACRDDGMPLLAMSIRTRAEAGREETVRRLPDLPLNVTDAEFDIADDEYAEIVRKVLTEEVGRGEGANFVIKRSFTATIPDFSPRAALTVFRRLLEAEQGAYWIFLVHTGDRTFVGASPERHVSLRDGSVVMNPVSGTYRYPPGGPTVSGALDFLADRKETEELWMVVDEELKMMARLCDGGGRVVGPYLKEMARLAHTEYLLEGRSSRDVRDVLRETMLAPTVTGSPVESACRVIERYEPAGRGYYSGVVALLGCDAHGRQSLDSSILIRTAEFDRTGRMSVGVGATLVRHSSPEAEAAETRAKAASILGAVRGDRPARPLPDGRVTERIAGHPAVRRELARRNTDLARFWLDRPGRRERPLPALAGRRVLVIDAEDTFTTMLGRQLSALGLSVAIRRYDEPGSPDGQDLVLIGPGPGDPRDVNDRKIAILRGLTRSLLREQRPFLSVCLGHQVLSGLLGFELIRKAEPNQGRQRELDLFGRRRRLGFYNTFAAVSSYDEKVCEGVPGLVEVGRDPWSGEVHALRGPGFRSMQFHPESVLSPDGLSFLADTVTGLLSQVPVGALSR